MSFVKITKTNYDNSIVRLHPSRSFSSSSSGVTGSVRVIAQSSPSFKEVSSFSPFVDSPLSDNSIESYRSALFSLTGSGLNVLSASADYMSLVSSASMAARQSKYVEVLRFEQTNTLTSDSIRKSVYRKNLLPFYKTKSPDSGFHYTNYQCFNFVSSSAFPSASALVYPEPLSEYAVVTGFTFSFNVNVNRDAGYRPATAQAFDYPAGTVMFRSSSYALSIVSGSSRDDRGRADKFRVLLQLSGAVDTDPSTLDLNSLPDNTFISSDNVLHKNNWHNVAVTWGKDSNAGTGSFFVDGVKDEAADFKVGTININTGSEQSGLGNFGVMIGARFSGSNDEFTGFFGSSTNASLEGVYSGGAGSEPHPSGTVNRFNGEVHDIRIHSNHLASDAVMTGSQFGLTTLPPGLVFYVPCFFVKESPVRKSLLTPFQQETTGTQEPFNVKLDFGVNGRDINVQNFTREFVQKTYPRLHFLTASTIDTSTSTHSADAFLLDIGSNKNMHRAREMFILPSDNGKFIPGWRLLLSGNNDDFPEASSPMSRFVEDGGQLNLSIVSNNNMLPTGSVFEGLMQVNSDGSDDTSKSGIVQQIMGSSPEDASVDPGSGFTILQRTRDNSSNQVVFFDASNLFYGNRIEPSTFTLTCQDLSGTEGTLSMRLADNGNGGLIRADAHSKLAVFSRVGDVLYQEGITAVQHPCIPFFGKNDFSLSFKGDQNIHVYEVNVPALAGTLNSSSNPQFVAGAKDNYAASYEGNAVGISSILFHDENFNVVARTTLAQPILKTEFDKYMFRVKFDF